MRIVKRRLFVLDLVLCYSRDAQREWMKLGVEGHMNKKANPEKVCKQFFSKEEDLSHMKYRYIIIGRRISIKVL